MYLILIIKYQWFFPWNLFQIADAPVLMKQITNNMPNNARIFFKKRKKNENPVESEKKKDSNTCLFVTFSTWDRLKGGLFEFY